MIDTLYVVFSKQSDKSMADPEMVSYSKSVASNAVKELNQKAQLRYKIDPTTYFMAKVPLINNMDDLYNHSMEYVYIQVPIRYAINGIGSLYDVDVYKHVIMTADSIAHVSLPSHILWKKNGGLSVLIFSVNENQLKGMPLPPILKKLATVKNQFRTGHGCTLNELCENLMFKPESVKYTIDDGEFMQVFTSERAKRKYEKVFQLNIHGGRL